MEWPSSPRRLISSKGTGLRTPLKMSSPRLGMLQTTLTNLVESASDAQIISFVHEKCVRDVGLVRQWLKSWARSTRVPLEQEHELESEWRLFFNPPKVEPDQEHVGDLSASERAFDQLRIDSHAKCISQDQQRNKGILDDFRLHFFNLPHTVIRDIVAGYCDQNDKLISLPFVCKYFRIISAHPLAWKHLVISVPRLSSFCSTSFSSFLVRSCKYLTKVTFIGVIKRLSSSQWSSLIDQLSALSQRQYASGSGICLNTVVILSVFRNREEVWLKKLLRIKTLEHLVCPIPIQIIEGHLFLAHVRDMLLRPLLTFSCNIVDELLRESIQKCLTPAQLATLSPVKSSPGSPMDINSSNSLLMCLPILLPPTVTEFVIPTCISKSYVDECIPQLRKLRRLNFYYVVNVKKKVNSRSWGCLCTPSTILRLARYCPHLEECRLYVDDFIVGEPTWAAIHELLDKCLNLKTLSLAFDITFGATMNEYFADRQTHRQFLADVGRKSRLLKKRFRKVKPRVVDYDHFTIGWCDFY